MAKEKRSDVHPVRKGALSVLINFILLVFSISCIFPIFWMIYSSLKEKGHLMQMLWDFPRILH